MTAALRTFASAEAACIYDDINSARGSDQLDHVARTMWGAYGNGAISEDDVNFLSLFIERRRPCGRSSATGGHLKAADRVVSRIVARVSSRFTPRQPPRPPDRKASRDRRRMLGGSGVIPANLRHHYTEGQRAVLCIIVGEVKHHGICDLPNDKIAALAGVCRTTVQTTLHEARRLFHIKITERPQPGRKHLPNVVEIASPEWRIWLKRGPSAHRPIGSKSFFLAGHEKIVSTTKSIVQESKRHPISLLRRRWWQEGPPSRQVLDLTPCGRVPGITAGSRNDSF